MLTMRTIRSLLMLLSALMLTTECRTQGCSDAGVCTAGPLGEIGHDGPDSLVAGSSGKHFVRLTASYGIGERRTSIVQSVAEVGFSGDLFGIQVRVPFVYASGDLGSNSGVGDPVVTLSFPFRLGEKNRLELIGGAKFPANRANASVDGRPLPMPYQTSLGTTDLLGGIQYRRGRFTAAFAYQHVAQQFNENGFTHGRWLDDMAAVGYFPSDGLRRADDAVMRLQFATHRGRLSIQPGLLAIYHMAPDERLEALPDPAGNLPVQQYVAVAGSEGLTLNLTVDGRYRLNDNWSLDLSYGAPLIVREQRPDGLTRFMVTNLAITRRF
jgi:hypothetical protein